MSVVLEEWLKYCGSYRDDLYSLVPGEVYRLDEEITCVHTQPKYKVAAINLFQIHEILTTKVP